ncbi:MAG: hybrid sensor histidine kinase/response regulator [Burkholderiales bacterium]|nr:hybrid sensor histidine kinase/response regulator [Burkholderiales bacterium]
MKSPAPAQDLDALILREQAASLFVTIRGAIYSDSVITLVFGAVMYWQMHRMVILVWMAVHLVTLLRMPAATAHFRDAEDSQHILRWIDTYCRELRINSAGWGAAPLLFLPDSLPLVSVMTLVLMGMSMGGTIAVAPLRRATYNLLLPMMLGLMLALLLHASLLNVFLTCCCLVFVVAVLHFARAQHELLTASLRTRFEKTVLAERLEEQIRATERANQEKTRFLAAASHDLRQPLHAIALLGAAMERELAGRPEQAGAARLMRAVNALSLSLDTMLDVSRLDAGVVPADRHPVALQGVFNSLNHSFVNVASEKGIQLRFRATPLWVESDPQLLGRLLSNLIDNAIKYTQRGGVLVVARRRASEAGLHDSEVWIDIRDSGIGIAPEHQSRVFEEFYQVSNPGRDRSLGLGIGLSIVKRLSHLLAHPVELKSVLGLSTRLRIRLPAASPQPMQAVDPAPPRSLGSAPWRPSTRVLVLDDEADVREAMCRLLRSHEIEVEVVSSETEAVAALDKATQGSNPFSLLICDFRLSDGDDGLQVGQALSQQFCNVPLLLVTGETAPERLQRVHEAGVPVLFKPVSAEGLLHAIAAAMPTSTSPAMDCGAGVR